MLNYLLKITISLTFLCVLPIKYNEKLKQFQTLKDKKLAHLIRIIIVFFVIFQKYLTWGTVIKSKTVLIEFGVIIHVTGNLVRYLCIMHKTNIHHTKIVECFNILVKLKSEQPIRDYNIQFVLFFFSVDVICQISGTITYYWEDFFSNTKLKAFYYFSVELYIVINTIVAEINCLIFLIVLLQHFKSINCDLMLNSVNFETFLKKRAILCKITKNISNVYSSFLLLIFFLYTFTTIGLVVLVYFSFELNISKVSNADGVGFSIAVVKLLILVWISYKCM